MNANAKYVASTAATGWPSGAQRIVEHTMASTARSNDPNQRPSRSQGAYEFAVRYLLANGSFEPTQSTRREIFNEFSNSGSSTRLEG